VTRVGGRDVPGDGSVDVPASPIGPAELIRRPRPPTSGPVRKWVVRWVGPACLDAVSGSPAVGAGGLGWQAHARRADQARPAPLQGAKGFGPVRRSTSDARNADRGEP
jgi:hypothetical protein